MSLTTSLTILIQSLFWEHGAVLGNEKVFTYCIQKPFITYKKQYYQTRHCKFSLPWNDVYVKSKKEGGDYEQDN